MENRTGQRLCSAPFFYFILFVLDLICRAHDWVSRLEDQRATGAIPRLTRPPRLPSPRSQHQGAPAGQHPAGVPAAGFRTCTRPACIAVPLLAGKAPRASAGGCVSWWEMHPPPWVEDIGPCYAGAACKKGEFTSRARALGRRSPKGGGGGWNETELLGPVELACRFCLCFLRGGGADAQPRKLQIPRGA